MARGIPNADLDEKIAEAEAKVAQLREAKKAKMEKDNAAVGRMLRRLSKKKFDHGVYDLIASIGQKDRENFEQLFEWLLNGDVERDLLAADEQLTEEEEKLAARNQQVLQPY